MRSTLSKTSNGPIEYRLEGAGPVVMVLNGGHCSRNTRLSHERLAGCGFSVLTPSRPGYDATPSSVGRTAQEAADALAGLLDTLSIPTVSLIGISAAGPTALAFAQRYPTRTRHLILESAVTVAWDEQTKRHAPLLFGRAEKLTWALARVALKYAPAMTMKAILRAMTTLDVNDVFTRLSPADRAFVAHMIQTSQSGTGFLLDLEHQLERLDGITMPVLVMYSPHDKSVPRLHAARIMHEVATAEAYPVLADTHLIWIGQQADEVWHKRLAFLTT